MAFHDPPEVPDILEETLGELAFAMEARSQATYGGVISTSSGASAERGESLKFSCRHASTPMRRRSAMKNAHRVTFWRSRVERPLGAPIGAIGRFQ
jgi:hypothetical protein